MSVSISQQQRAFTQHVAARMHEHKQLMSVKNKKSSCTFAPTFITLDLLAEQLTDSPKIR